MQLSSATVIAISVAVVFTAAIFIFMVLMKISSCRDRRNGRYRRNSDNGHSVIDADWEAAIPLPDWAPTTSESERPLTVFQEEIGAPAIRPPRRARIRELANLEATTFNPFRRIRSRGQASTEAAITISSPRHWIANMEATTSNLSLGGRIVRGQAPTQPEDDHPSAADWQGLVFKETGQRMIKRTQTVFSRGTPLSQSHYEFLPPTAESLRIANLPPVPATTVLRREGELGTQVSWLPGFCHFTQMLIIVRHLRLLCMLDEAMKAPSQIPAPHLLPHTLAQLVRRPTSEYDIATLVSLFKR